MGIVGNRRSHTAYYPYTGAVIAPNPDPNNFLIKWSLETNGFTIAYVNYPDAKNYEGDKLIVFRGLDKNELLSLTTLDPHFEKKSKIIARFKPDSENIGLAISLFSGMKDSK